MSGFTRGPWKVSGGPPPVPYYVEQPTSGHCLRTKGDERMRTFRTLSGAIRACDIANAERHKALTRALGEASEG